MPTKKQKKQYYDKWKQKKDPQYFRDIAKRRYKRKVNKVPYKKHHRRRTDFDFEPGTLRQRILDLSNRLKAEPNIVAEKYLQNCERCGWDESYRDIHHKKPISKGGNSQKSNLVTLCPNCHRLEHMGPVVNKKHQQKIRKNAIRRKK